MRRRFDQVNCSIAQTLEVLGDWWTLLIVREAFTGTRRFADFQENLGISKNILTARLRHLVDHGVFETVDVGQYGVRHEYVLTRKGKDLVTLMTAIRQWGDRWIFGEGNEPVRVLDRRTGRPVGQLRICDDAGEPMSPGDFAVVPGPGADDETRARFARALERRRGETA